MRFLICWAISFISLVAALVLLNIYYTILGKDLTLRSARQETAIAGIASLIEGASGWLIISFVPAAVRAMFVPVLMVAIIYKFAHLEDWNRYDLLMLFMFQIILGASCTALFFGHFATAAMVLGIFGAFLVILASIVRNL